MIVDNGGCMADAVRDELYGDIEMPAPFLRVLDTAPMQRLRRIQQLGLTYLVYPGATHTRFSHSVGVYHLMTRAVRVLEKQALWREVPAREGDLLRLAGLVHDTQHYPAAHFIEEVGHQWASHEDAALDVFSHKESDFTKAANRIHPDAAARIPGLIGHGDPSPLAHLLSSGVDMDKLDYLRRDLTHTGYPAMVDQDGIIRHLRLLRSPAGSPTPGNLTVGLHEDGLPAWESMLFAKYFLYRQVLFADTVRSATAMMRALVLLAIEEGMLEREELMTSTDQDLLGMIRDRLRSLHGGKAESVLRRLWEGVSERRLYGAALKLPVRRFPRLRPEDLPVVEKALSDHLGFAPGEVLLDLPHRPDMLDMGVWVQRSGGQVQHATELGTDGGIAIQHLAEAAYHASSRALVLTSRKAHLEERDLWDVLGKCGYQPVDGESEMHTSRRPVAAR